MIIGIEKIQNITGFKDSWKEYLNQFPWDWFVTLTFRNEISTKSAFRLFNKWKVQLKKAVNQKIHYLLVIDEPRFKGDSVHFHVLMSGVKDEDPEAWMKKWYDLAGNPYIKRYDFSMGASGYLADKVVRKEADYIFSKDINEIAPIPNN